MIAAIYAHKSTEQNSVGDKQKSVARRISVSAGVVVVCLAIGCSGKSPFASERDALKVADLFSRGARFGMAPDAGLYKQGIDGLRWDHVATIHGMADDIGLCESLVEALSRTAPTDRYACRLLNN